MSVNIELICQIKRYLLEMKRRLLIITAIVGLIGVLAFQSDSTEEITAGVYRDIYFDFGTDTLDLKRSQMDLYYMYKLLDLTPDNSYELRVHLGAGFFDESSIRRSQQHADKLVSYFYSIGIDSSAIKPVGMESSQMIIPKARETGQFWANRRVELVLVKQN